MTGTPKPRSGRPEISIDGETFSSASAEPSTSVHASTDPRIPGSEPSSAESRKSSPALEGHFQGSGSALDAAFNGGKGSGTLDATMDGADGEDDGPFKLTQQHDNAFLYYRARHAAQDAVTKKIITLNSEKRIEEEDWKKAMSAWAKEMEELKAMGEAPATKHEEGYLKTFKTEGREFYKHMDIKQDGSTMTVSGFDPKEHKAYAIKSTYKSGAVETRIENPTPMSLLTAIELQKSIAAQSKSRKIIIVSVTDKETLLQTIAMIRSQNMAPELSTQVKEQLRDYVKEELGKGASFDAVEARMNEYMTKEYFMGINPGEMTPIKPAAAPPQKPKEPRNGESATPPAPTSEGSGKAKTPTSPARGKPRA